VRRVPRLLALALLPVMLVAIPARSAPESAPFEIGADLSSLPHTEAGGAAFRDRNGAADAIALLKRGGFTAVRLRLWHSPAGGECGLDSTLALARRAHAAGLRVLLDLHFSDTWADPGHQAPPAAWRGLSAGALAESAGAYAHGAVAALVAQGTPPAAVQVGNEVDAGVLWDEARVGGSFDTPAHWAAFTSVLAAAATGVHAACPAARVVVHLASGGDRVACVRALDRMVAARVPFDVIGLSYYPWWHGSLEALRANLAALARRYGRDVMVVETAYPWTLGWFDAERNLVGRPEQLLAGFPATPAGQAAFARAVRRVVQDVPDDRGAGVWWWEPAWIAAPRGASPWENCALFDSSGTALPALRTFAR
jgi:arabinogalactan endo-1,4-beta-galactosidase